MMLCVFSAFAGEDTPQLPRVAEDNFDQPNVTYNVVDGNGATGGGIYGGGYNMGYSGGSVPMNGGIGLNGPGSSGFSGYPAFTGQTGMPQVALDDSGSCPFNNQSDSVQNIWNSTRDILTQIQQQDNQNSQGCGLVQANSNTLQQALDTYQQQRYRTVDGDGSAASAVSTRSAQLSGRIQPDCENYELLYQNEYEQILSLVSRNFELSAMPADYHSSCAEFYPTSQDNFSYSSDFTTCLADTLAQKIEVAHIECDGKSEFLDDIENQQNTFTAQQNALLRINNAISQLSGSLNNCDNRDMVRSSLRSIINVGTMVASPALGGVGGVFAAFGGSILDNIVGLLFSSRAASDLAEMDREDRYEQTACLFYNAERLKCASRQNSFIPNNIHGGGGFGYPYPYGPCQEDRRPPEVLEVQSLIDTLMGTINRLPSGRKAAELSRFLNAPLSSNPESTNLEFMQDPVLRTLRENSLYEDAANLENFINTSTALIDLQRRLQSAEQSASEVIPNPVDTTAPPAPAFEVLQNLEQRIYETDFSSSLYSFTQIGEDSSANNVAMYREYASQITEQFYEQQRSAISNWRNSRQLDMAMSAMVNNLQRDHAERLETHFQTDLQTAIALSAGSMDNPITRENAFNQLSGIINDCMFMEGMHTYQRVDLDSEARSTSQVERSRNYEQYCGNFSCLNNFEKFYPNDELTPTSFSSYQCAKYTSANWLIESLRSEFQNTGKICDKTLEEIYREGNRRRR